MIWGEIKSVAISGVIRRLGVDISLVKWLGREGQTNHKDQKQLGCDTTALINLALIEKCGQVLHTDALK